ncbi:MAG: glycine zipper 2TM domain-containing protein [Rhodoferax sp.]|uniref:beta/gamma crystallin-related protein n=1 Tax=Rhodoferax sp. TaxID=50421 RepID=UPI0013FFEF92|nr:beta/gamma crystallin-related protein [Rhodoferax sp.]NDP37481.1 glycine zipper 2TM domain-containing protein [Rhodoferax sp.]
MNALLKNALAVTAVAMAAQASAQVTLFEQDGYRGESFTTSRTVDNLERRGFNDRASSAVVVGARWEACEDQRFNGRCVVLRPGKYPSLNAMGLSNRVTSVRAVSRNARIADQRYAPAPAPVIAAATPQITFYENEGLSGRSFTTERQVNNFNRFGFNNRASSAAVVGERWEVCDDVRFRGQCVVLRQGTYSSLRAMGLNDRVSSVRMLNRNERVSERRYAPAPLAAPVAAAPDFRPQRDERLFEANVTSVRAVMGTPEQRCWVEPGQVAQSNNNVPGAIAGALLGGILGHQVGGGTGKDLATVGGVIAGAALGSQVNGGNQQAATQDVRRCENVPNQKPQYWDVTYNFRGQDHRVQMTTPPGQTVTVNHLGEPRK